MFTHLNPYYLNFLKAQIFKCEATTFKTSDKFPTLVKESPIVIVCDDGQESAKLVKELENDGFINAYQVLGGAQNLAD